jgi:hypothetical protein
MTRICHSYRVDLTATSKSREDSAAHWLVLIAHFDKRIVISSMIEIGCLVQTRTLQVSIPAGTMHVATQGLDSCLLLESFAQFFCTERLGFAACHSL